MNEGAHICLIAGESSGDFLGSRLMAALRAQKPGIRFSGVGGPLMAAEGLQSLFPMTDLSVMGLAEVLPRLPLLMRRIDQTVRHIRKEQPDIVVTVDSPDFSFRVAKALKGSQRQTLGENIAAYASGNEDVPPFRMPRMIHYVAPTVWAWRPERAKKMAALYDGVICLFPFEPPWFTEHGMKAVFAGHPAVEMPKGDEKRLALPEGGKILGLLFGSRMGELNRTGPALREVALRYVQDHPDTQILALTLPHLEREVRNLLQGFPCRVHIVQDQAKKADCFSAMHAALATSGTVGLELAVAGVPHAIGYRMNPLTWAMVRRKFTIKYAHLVNILFEDEAVPEFIQKNCDASKIHETLKALMEDDIVRARQRMMFDKFRQQIAAPGGYSSPQLAASFVMDECLNAVPASGMAKPFNKA